MSSEKCGGRTRASTPCQNAAGYKTTHVGVGKCFLHGGSTPNHEKAAERQHAEQAVARYALPRTVDPATALLEEVHRSAGVVAFLANIVNRIEEQQLVEATIAGKQPVVWLRLLKSEREHLARVARSAVDAGIAERQVRMVEAVGGQLVSVLRAVLSKLGHDPDTPEVRLVVSEALRAIA